MNINWTIFLTRLVIVNIFKFDLLMLMLSLKELSQILTGKYLWTLLVKGLPLTDFVNTIYHLAWVWYLIPLFSFINFSQSTFDECIRPNHKKLMFHDLILIQKELIFPLGVVFVKGLMDNHILVVKRSKLVVGSWATTSIRN